MGNTRQQLSLAKKALQGLAASLIFAGACAQAEDTDGQGSFAPTPSYEFIQGTAVTGFNRLLGMPVWDLGNPFGGMGFNFVFGYNPGGGSVPLDLTPFTPMDTLVASGYDAAFAPFFPAPDPIHLNLPFRDVHIIVGEDGTRAPVPMVQDAAGDAPSKSYPNADITLGEWLSAEGNLAIRCFDNGTSKIKANFKNLIPNGIYTLWGVFGFDFDGDGVYDTAAPVALGGVPNALVANLNGRARIKRNLNFCPTGSSLLTVNLAYHSDGNVYGAVPEPGLLGFPGGSVTHDQINFPINVAGEM